MDNGTTDATRTPRNLGGPGPEPAWLRPGWFVLLLAGMVAVVFPQVLAGTATFVARDFGDFSCPIAYYQRACFWQGDLPFWNPYSYCGLPFLAQWNTMCLYPPALIYLLLPLPWSLNFFSLLHLWFGGWGMYLLARRWTHNRLAASVAGVVFAFNGLSLNFLMWPSHIATFSWMPWVVLMVESAWKEGRRKLTLAGLAAAMQLLAGAPESILFTWLILLGLWGMHFVWGKDTASGARARMAWRLALAGLLAFGLAAVQLLPFLDLAAHSQRELGFADTAGSMPGFGWANFLVPMAFGRIFPEGFFLQAGQQWTSSYYFGIGALLLSLLAVWGVRDRRVWLLIVAACVAFVCALGSHTFIYPLLQKLMPPLTLMTYPVKFVILIVFAASLLAAFGIAWVQTQTGAVATGRGTRIGGVLAVLVVFILLWAWRSPTPGSEFSVVLASGLTRIGFLVAILLILFLLKKAGSRQRPYLTTAALLTLLWLDVWTHEPPQNPTVSPSVFTEGQAQVELGLQPPPLLGQCRVMVSREAKRKLDFLHDKDVETAYIARRLGFFSNCNLLDAVPNVDGFFSLTPADFDGLYYALYFTPDADFSRLTDFLSVAHITAPGKLSEWLARTNWLPMVTAGQKPVFLDPPATARRLSQPDFHAGNVVFLPPETEPVVSATHKVEASVGSLRFGRQQVDFKVATPEPSLAVISQTYYHWWRAYVDAKPAPLLKANYAFQAVPVPRGVHDVRLVYEDRTFKIGLIISLVALLACVPWHALRRRFH